MNITNAEIRERLQLSEDGRWEFKQIEFSGNRPKSPRRDDFADEITAFANSDGGVILCGVSDRGELQGMSREQAAALSLMLAEVSVDTIKPPLNIILEQRQLDGKIIVLVEIPRGTHVHERAGHAYLRVGPTKRSMGHDERLRLAQQRAQSRYLWFDRQAVPNTGFNTLVERLWEPLLSTAGADDPLLALKNMGLIISDVSGMERATVAGILLCTNSPHVWLPQAIIRATMYRGTDRSSGHLDMQEIQGPLSLQIADAMKFVTRNMRVATRKTPARENIPQYHLSAVFEAVVNAVVHRDYSMAARHIRLSMFKNRLEIDSPGVLPNGMTIEGMSSGRADRNPVLASILGRFPVGNVPGSEHRRYIMEQRGDGVSIIFKKTRELLGVSPEYRIIDQTNLVLIIPAAKLQITPLDAIITVYSKGQPVEGADILALFPNKSWVRAVTDENGEANVTLDNSHLPMTVYAAMPGYSAAFMQEWIPNQEGLVVELNPLIHGGSIIFLNASGHIPGLYGRLNLKRNDRDQTYLYADHISIDQGRQQPVSFRLGKPMRLTDTSGFEVMAKIIDLTDQAALIEYQKLTPGS